LRVAIVTSCFLFIFRGLASPSGVLIGLRDNSNTYRTIWIVAESGAPAVAAVVKGLVVPRKNGLWRIDVEQETCGDIGQYQVDELRIEPLDAGSGAPTPRDCETIAKASCGSVYPAGDGLTLEHWLLYAGPTHFAERFWFAESCGAHPVGATGFSVHDIDHPEQDVPIQMVFQEGNMDALQSAARQALICGTDDLDCIDSRDRYQVSPSSGWGIARAPGQWSVLVALSPPDPSLVAPSPVVTAFPVPAAILGSSEGQEPETAIAGLPEGDRSFSPAGDMAIVQSEGLAAFRLGSGSIDGPPTRVETSNGEQVVMIEWAVGSQVAEWDTVMRGVSNDATMAPASKR